VALKDACKWPLPPLQACACRSAAPLDSACTQVVPGKHEATLECAQTTVDGIGASASTQIVPRQHEALDSARHMVDGFGATASTQIVPRQHIAPLDSARHIVDGGTASTQIVPGQHEAPDSAQHMVDGLQWYIVERGCASTQIIASGKHEAPLDSAQNTVDGLNGVQWHIVERNPPHHCPVERTAAGTQPQQPQPR